MTGQITPIDSGFAVNCNNNDHGVSPHGKWLAISDQTQCGRAAIYILSITGGKPRRVTQNTPSYWHGWSPDAAHLAYIADRGAGFQVYTIPAEGAPEFAVTAGFDHCDDPDYSPDGAWIWFNGEKDGKVEI